MTCPERQELILRFRSAFDDFSAVARELKIANPPDEHVQNRSTQARTACEQLWAELQEHQSKHKCWR